MTYGLSVRAILLGLSGCLLVACFDTSDRDDGGSESDAGQEPDDPYAVIALHTPDGASAVVERLDEGVVRHVADVGLPAPSRLSVSDDLAWMIVSSDPQDGPPTEGIELHPMDGAGPVALTWPEDPGACGEADSLGHVGWFDGAFRLRCIPRRASGDYDYEAADSFALHVDGSVEVEPDLPAGCELRGGSPDGEARLLECSDGWRSVGRDDAELFRFADVPDTITFVRMLAPDEMAAFFVEPARSVIGRWGPSGLIQEGAAFPLASPTDPPVLGNVSWSGQLAMANPSIARDQDDVRVFDPWTGDGAEVNRCTVPSSAAGFSNGVSWSPIPSQAVVHCRAGLRLLDLENDTSTEIYRDDVDSIGFVWFSHDGARLLIQRGFEADRTFEVYDAARDELTPAWPDGTPTHVTWLRGSRR